MGVNRQTSTPTVEIEGVSPSSTLDHAMNGFQTFNHQISELPTMLEEKRQLLWRQPAMYSTLTLNTSFLSMH
ncbi:hypothetical protein FS842_008071 [Serendipita sp. 407]|nr:hypothetical protein FS842_008071 [Serendipita sp. 407]